MIKRYSLFSLGWLSLVLGVIGIFLPIMPTTPFILLAAWCFARSSPRFHGWLHGHYYLGPIVQAWESGEGIPLRVRNRVLLLLWFSLFCSTLLLRIWWVGLILFLVGVAVSVYMLRLPVLDERRAPVRVRAGRQL